MDNFGYEIPSFNIRGETSINTVIGGALTFAIIILALFFAITQMNKLSEDPDPITSQSLKPNEFSPDENFNINDMNFRVAFTIEGANPLNGDFERKDDPRYVKQYARYFGMNKDGVRNDIIIPFHDCTDADYELFNPLVPIY